ncbi:23S rRNA (pseudouridine(1915)-N(3))-methyltransferase RlmH [Aliikangiella coralliicola]|uniref:Ribosomal RNA large subunit methyltransferase H n=1 Tax=Aliikangiella coralliicola TaxID=2592383 RepID=A0A545U7J8_9GAMM|nr:23S rRNA (pseudouridine(1915)-N(3))-methyltransferase RlmH [Aliikangiella coralliicola]TQV85446.1 23S rRNA (pseudouridine(1915)-N(3))-methyltransferase RlmH [Aliikangiella coralliicola]
MKIKLIAVGTKMPDWVIKAYTNYAQRLPRDCSLELIEIAAAKRTRNSVATQWMEKEGEQILKVVDKSDWVVALDVKGKNWSTQQLSQRITDWQHKGGNVSLLVGGPDGLSPKCLSLAKERWSLSGLTLPHPLVRVVLAEAIYRAWTVTVNHPYHRE